MKGAFYTMNKFSTDVSSAALIGEGWVPTEDIDTLRDRLTKVTESLGSGVPAIVKILSTKSLPPTYHVTNKYTVAFQVLLERYACVLVERFTHRVSLVYAGGGCRERCFYSMGGRNLRWNDTSDIATVRSNLHVDQLSLRCAILLRWMLGHVSNLNVTAVPRHTQLSFLNISRRL